MSVSPQLKSPSRLGSCPTSNKKVGTDTLLAPTHPSPPSCRMWERSPKGSSLVHYIYPRAPTISSKVVRSPKPRATSFSGGGWSSRDRNRCLGRNQFLFRRSKAGSPRHRVVWNQFQQNALLPVGGSFPQLASLGSWAQTVG